MNFETPQNPEKEKPKAFITYGQPSHPNEYVINIEDYGVDDFIPYEVVSKIKDNIGDEWDVASRGNRIEIYGDKSEKVESAISKILEKKYNVEIK